MLYWEKSRPIRFTAQGWFDSDILMDPTETMKRLCAHVFDI